jgi:hypothetical protein
VTLVATKLGAPGGAATTLKLTSFDTAFPAAFVAMTRTNNCTAVGALAVTDVAKPTAILPTSLPPGVDPATSV